MAEADLNENGQKTCACEGATLVKFIQPTILSLLDKEPCHGYELLQRIGKTGMWADADPDPSGVYRVLRDMEKRGLVSSRIVHDKGVGLGRKVYSLTEDGIVCRRKWLKTLEKYQQDLTEVICLLKQ